jgi:hypothetical protein
MSIDEARGALVRDDEGLAWMKDYRPFYDDPEDNASALLGRALSRHTYVIWSSGGHTSDLVPAYGRGPGAEKLRGVYPNTHIYTVMREALETRRDALIPTQPRCQNRVKIRRSLSSFDQADGITMQIASVGEVFLRYSKLLACVAQDSAKGHRT